ncbi:MAG: carboxylating nicotinate-nucleotide diphosphorylase [Candidatus Omnitrophota bacterium]
MAYDKYFLSEKKPQINPKELKAIIKRALAEDIGKGDITTNLTIAKNAKVVAKIIAKENFILCGNFVAKNVFTTVDPTLKFIEKIKEGGQVEANDTIAIITGKARSILNAERVALNLLALLCGVATKTNQFVQKIAPYKTKITDTRKTVAGLRELQKYAVRVAGGYNHRMRLDEMLLIKDNHLRLIGGYPKLPKIPKGYKVEMEAQSLNEFKHLLNFKPDIIMLDNMNISDMKKAVQIRANLPILLEASGGINIHNIRKYASTGVDIISVGELTHSVKSVDISLEII